MATSSTGKTIVVGRNIISLNSYKETYIGEKFESDGETAQVDFSYIYRTGSLMVFVNGIFQEVDNSYEEGSNRKFITWLTVPDDGSKVEVRYVVD